jgi:hypothetical protein
MTVKRIEVGRIVAIGAALALALLLLGAREASAGKYTVAQCGWHVDADADWADTTGGAKFRRDAYCATPTGADPFDGAHLKSFTRSGDTVSGTRFARWRWTAPGGTGITRISGTWWHALHDGFEQRIGSVGWNGAFTPFRTASVTDTSLRDFVVGFAAPVAAIEDRLLCARAESRWCSLDPDSWSSIRAVTLTLEDDIPPGPAFGGQLTEGGWRRGDQNVIFWSSDVGGGTRFAETLLDGARVNLTEYPCAKVSIGGEWRAARMEPCSLGIGGDTTIATTNFSDGPHTLNHCSTDFAGNVACANGVTVLIDNNPPAHPRDLALAGGPGWRRVNDFDLRWANPDQGRASPIAGASWRVTGPAGYDSGVRFAGGRGRQGLDDLHAPRPGAYTVSVWLRDEAGNEAPDSAVSLPLRFDDVPPGVAFSTAEGDGVPDEVQAAIGDAHAGAAGGSIHYRRLNAERWIELPTRFQADGEPGAGTLTALLPRDLEPGTYVFRADAVDAAGNTTSTTRRADGTQMAVRKSAAGAAATSPSARRAEAARGKTRLFAHLRWRRRRGPGVTIPFGRRALLSGRLLDAEGAGLAGRRLRVVARPSHGALSRRRVFAVGTGPHGGFRLPLPPGPSRRVTVSFAGESGLEGARRPALALRVRGAVELHLSPARLRTGETLRLWGRVRTRGAPVPRRGKLVAIQYFETAARRWRPVLVTRSNHGGRFRARYRFRYVTGAARIRLRAVALAEERWPYAPGASKPVVVHVSG